MTDESTQPPQPEPPLTKPDVLDDYEVSGVVSILIKTVAADDRINALTKQVEALNASISADRLNRAKGVNALSIYGFDSAHPKVWTAVREVIGDERYEEAIAIARGKFPQLLKKPEAEKTETSPKTDATVSNVSSLTTPTIGDAVLAFLKDCGDSGAKISAVKEQLSKAYGFETHEKTPGMTLYRLLKEGKVRREGRTWFFVDPTTPETTENPGDDSPGNDNTAVEKETAE